METEDGSKVKSAAEAGAAPADFEDVGDRWVAAMRCGDFEAAWRQTDRIELSRRQCESAGRFTHGSHHLLWNGSPFDGKRVLVRSNHGLGDTIQFARYVKCLQRIARDTIFYVQPHLVELFARSSGYGRVCNGWTDAPPPHDIEIEIMELPYAFRSTLATLPAEVPYLSLERSADSAFYLPLAECDDEFRIGVVWASSDWDTSRSIPLASLLPLARCGGVRFYSLQQGRAAEEWRSAPFAIEPLSRHTTDITALAAAMQRLDLVIAVDCMVAHLAGALARPVWTLLLHQADWRWMAGRSDSPWYPTMRLFRQSRRGDWTSVVDDAASALADVLVRARAPG